jgi:protein CpxP
MRAILKYSLAAAGLSLALLGAGAGYAQPLGGPHGPDRMLSHMAERLDLSDEQSEQIGKILDSGYKSMDGDRARMRELRDQLRGSDEAFDDKAARQAADELGRMTADMHYNMARTHHEIRQVLTPEQRQQWDAMREEHGDMRGKKGWKHHMDGPREEPTE